MRDLPGTSAASRLTRIPHSVLVQLMELMENPSLMELKHETDVYKVFYRTLSYSDRLSVGAWRSLTFSSERVLIDTWDLFWIKNPAETGV
jgi:hypothetical protein